MNNVSTLEADKVVEEARRSSARLVEEFQYPLFYKKIVEGAGTDFKRLRRYLPGDDISKVDWNSLAGTGDLYTRIFDDKRMINTVFLVDLSASMTVGSQEFTKNEYASILTTALADAAVTAGDKAGLIGFSDQERFFLEPESSKKMISRFADALTDKGVFGGGLNWKEARKSALKDLSQDTFLFIVSDFVNPDEDLYNFLDKCGEEFLGYFCIMVRDPLDSRLPKGAGRVYLSHPSTGETQLVNIDEVRDEFNTLARENENELKLRVESSGNYFFRTLTNQDFSTGLAEYLDQRLKKWI